MTAPALASDPRREQWIDALRGFIMLLMVFGHVWAGLEKSRILTSHELFQRLYDYIYFFHMPTLFAISGMLFSGPPPGKGLWANQARRSVRFVYPLVLWSYLYFLTKYLVGDGVNNPVTFNDVLFGPFPPKDHFWFLWALLLIQIAAALLVVSGLSNKILLFVLGLALPLALAYVPWIGTAWTAPAMQNAPFFFLGMLLGRTPFKASASGARAVLGAVFFVAIPVYAVLVASLQTVLLVLPLQCLCILSLLMTARGASPRFTDHPITLALIKAGQASMTIYLLHVFFTSGARIFLIALNVNDLLTHLVVATSLGVLVPIVIHFNMTSKSARKILGF